MQKKMSLNLNDGLFSSKLSGIPFYPHAETLTTRHVLYTKEKEVKHYKQVEVESLKDTQNILSFQVASLIHHYRCVLNSVLQTQTLTQTHVLYIQYCTVQLRINCRRKHVVY